jgi:hypothetical protein
MKSHLSVPDLINFPTGSCDPILDWINPESETCYNIVWLVACRCRDDRHCPFWRGWLVVDCDVAALVQNGPSLAIHIFKGYPQVSEDEWLWRRMQERTNGGLLE